MKTTLTTIFAIAVMVFAFNANPVMAGGGDSGIFGWITGESQVTEVETASWDDDEKADQYGDEWFNSENGEVDLANATCTIDQQTGQQVCCAPTSFGGFFCYYPNEDGKVERGVDIACSGRDAMYGCSTSAGQVFASMTMEEKVKQDEEDWNNWILQQFAGLEYDPDCEIELTLRGWSCTDPNKWFNKQEDGADQIERAIADSGQEGSSSSASDGDNASLVGDSGDTIDAVDTENDRVLESGDY